ncbi:MAG: nitrilase-related carbon-nitrogen hydrolase, partial [Desulfobacteraceae bacterium]
MKDISIAAVTCDAPVGDIDRNLATTVEWTLKAKEAGADLVCFPELNITGYCNRPEMADIALPVPGLITRELS